MSLWEKLGFLSVGVFTTLLNVMADTKVPSQDFKVPQSDRPILIRSDYQAGELTRLCDQALHGAQLQLDQLVQIEPKKRTLQNTLLAFEKIMADLSDQVAPLTFMGYVSTQSALSAEGAECEKKVNQFWVSVFTRSDLYQAVRHQDHFGENEAQLLKETLRSFEENGLKLKEEGLNEFRELKKKLSRIETEFSENLNQDQSSVVFSQDELEGVPVDYLSSLKKDPEGRWVVPTKRPDYVRIMENAVRSEARKKMLLAYDNRAAEKNTKLLEEALLLRQKLAKLLGYSSWVDFKTAYRMSQNSKTVSKFLELLKGRLVYQYESDLRKLRKLQKQLNPQLESSEIKAWDLVYLSYQLKKRELGLDDEVVREYFPAETVISGMFKIYSTLFDIRLVEEKGAQIWADGVKLYRILEGGSHQLVGYFYTDFVPRPGKFGHAAAFPLISGRKLSEKNYSHPVAAIVANFTPPLGGKPTLLSFEEVKTLFHEFGHILHQTLTRAPYASLSGSNVDRDFVETPSQMLENWVFSEEILKEISGHYQDSSKKLPPELVKKLILSRDFNQGLHYVRQLMLALFDLKIHTTEGSVNSVQVYQELHQSLMGLEPIEGTHFPATFGHMMGGYDSGYYGYLWSEVYSSDLFTRFQKGGLLNSKIGKTYRTTILEAGKMVNPFSLLELFLGRQPNMDAFFRRLHLKSS